MVIRTILLYPRKRVFNGTQIPDTPLERLWEFIIGESLTEESPSHWNFIVMENLK